jgi:iron complex outermembrane receptor protein
MTVTNIMKPRMWRALIMVAIACISSRSMTLNAQGTTPPSPAPPDTVIKRVVPDSTAKLGTVQITAKRNPETRVNTLQLLTLPVTASVTATKAQQTVNLVDPEDAVKYLPSIYIRKRNYGDTQATIGTRVWGVSSSARSLVYADGVPLTALIANNNTIGGPRWGLVSPEEISRIDMMYGPFSAAYPGNSMGAVMEITTRQPDSLEGSVEQTQAMQHFDLYGTRRNLATSLTNATVGDRLGRFSFWASGSYENSQSQPLLFVTSPTFPSGTSGGYVADNKLGAPANVLGATGLLHTGMTNAKLKLAYDITPILRAAYTFGFWNNDANGGVDTYIDQTAQPTFAGQSGFASGYYDLFERHTSQSFSLRTNNGGGNWDFEAVGTLYDFGKDQQRMPNTASASDATFGTPGRVAVLDGTGWATLDLKGAWHAGGIGTTHTVSFGAHDDRYALANPTYNTPDWRNGPFTTVATEGDGKTRTAALWAQDSWMITPAVNLTVGGRYEDWRGYDGFNVNGSTAVVQPTVTSSRFSPKAVLAWDATPEWRITASVGKAYRFATAAELYQLVSTDATFTSPNPDLKPDDDLASELRFTRKFDRGTAQLALFQDDVHNAIISQYLPLVPNSPTLYSYVSNVDHARARGAELSFGVNDVFTHGLDFSGSATYLDARTLALSGSASATAPAGSAVGKFLPNIPKWRGTFLGTYHPNARLAFSLAGRYSGKMFTTLDDADVNSNTYQGFSEWFVMDTRANYQIDHNWDASLGVDNLLDRKYFLFHPFPQRTVVAGLKYTL